MVVTCNLTHDHHRYHHLIINIMNINHDSITIITITMIIIITMIITIFMIIIIYFSVLSFVEPVFAFIDEAITNGEL